MIRFYQQNGWLNEGDYRLGLVCEKRHHEQGLTIDVCWWFGWNLISIMWGKRK